MRLIDADRLSAVLRNIQEHIKNDKAAMADAFSVFLDYMIEVVGNQPSLEMSCEPLTLDTLKQMNNEPVWVHVLDHEIFSDKADDFDGYGMCRASWVRVWDSSRADLVHVDYDFEDYGKTWIAYRSKP